MSPSQKKFKEFWGYIPEIYKNFRELLKKENKTTSGDSYRNFYENLDDHLSSYEKNHQFIFAGFNALSISELSSMKMLIQMKRAFFLSDADEFYTSDSIHEAGSFIRKNHEFLGVVIAYLFKKN